MAINEVENTSAPKPFESSFDRDTETKPQSEKPDEKKFQSHPEMDEPPPNHREWNDSY